MVPDPVALGEFPEQRKEEFEVTLYARFDLVFMVEEVV